MRIRERSFRKGRTKTYDLRIAYTESDVKKFLRDLHRAYIGCDIEVQLISQEDFSHMWINRVMKKAFPEETMREVAHWAFDYAVRSDYLILFRGLLEEKYKGKYYISDTILTTKPGALKYRNRGYE